MKITIVFPKSGDVTARFEDEIFTYIRTWKFSQRITRKYCLTIWTAVN